ncbi:MAG: C-GCAxxG-C-C family protein [Bacteroidales bacterium]|nr:C-GCAxxG-C-C family protein [Bacteroidales bacterium]
MDTDKIKKEAVSRFKSGFNCSQSVLAAMAPVLNTGTGTLEKISSGFGGGMGHMQGTCGAVTGSFMSISLFCGNKYSNNDERTNKAYGLIRQFNSEFTSRHGSTCCRELIKYELDSPEEHDKAVKANVFEEVCEVCIADSIDILSDLLK